ncbi:MAG TPA: deoxyribodipyrimidine photo-lyase [Gemmatimonadaceae bacterium]|nr:deoxyribodipyrimidine photo-lyase [Gemmatimonadaceae bacterium]
MTHPLGSPYVRDQLALRAHPLNPKRTQPEGEFVLYWMRSTLRIDENWALRYATLEADRLGRPLLIHHEVDPRERYASERSHTFVLQAVPEIARRAAELGHAYQLVVPTRRAEAGRALEALVGRAVLVVTDFMPTSDAVAAVTRVADAAYCRLVAVDSVGAVPAAALPLEEYAARTIRPKLARLLDFALEPVEDRGPRRPFPGAIWRSLDLERIDPASLGDATIAPLVARCEIDHEVPAVPLRGGASAARERLHAFVGDSLADYSERRRHPSDPDGSSRLSAHLHHGMIAAAEVARVVRASGAGAEADAFLNEMVTWRELALNFCARNPAHDSLDALPAWARRSMERHEDDPREWCYDLAALEEARTHSPLWNAAQRELRATGQMHNVARMLWGKSVVTWTPRYADALAWLIHLNDRWSLDGRDPNSYAGIQWCFGKFDRPFAERPVWGTIRPMSLERALAKYDVEDYIARWNGEPAMAGDRPRLSAVSG